MLVVWEKLKLSLLLNNPLGSVSACCWRIFCDKVPELRTVVNRPEKNE